MKTLIPKLVGALINFIGVFNRHTPQNLPYNCFQNQEVDNLRQMENYF